LEYSEINKTEGSNNLVVPSDPYTLCKGATITGIQPKKYT